MAVVTSMTLQAQTGSEGDDCNHESTQIGRFWHSLSPQERTDLLSITMDDFRAKLVDVTDAGEHLDSSDCICARTRLAS